MTLTVGSLFSGIGGLDLGLERAGMQVIWQSEIDPFACKVLKKHWPEVPNYGDIKQIDWATIPKPDVICGGYPCQPFSTAGKRRGTDDPRHLWPWVRTAISELRPRYAILENVRGHLTMGALQVLGEITELGYDAEWRIVSAAGVGAPHRRDRLIIVAYPNDARGRTPERGTNTVGAQEVQERQNVAQSRFSGCSTHVANTNGRRCQQCKPETKSFSWTSGSSKRNYADCWEVEPSVGRMVDGVSNRVDKLRGLGNAVVPQVAEYIGRLVLAAHNNS
jgi:DNA (cytosine-5)-methyltransferase 1